MKIMTKHLPGFIVSGFIILSLAAAPVLALTVSGSTVYAGGGFSSISGVPRSALAAIIRLALPQSTTERATARVNRMLK